MSEGGKMATKDDEAKRKWFLKLSHQLLFLRDRGKINLEKVQTVQDFILLSNLFDHCELKNLTYDDGDAFVFSPNEYFAEFHKQFKKERESLFRERLDPVLGRYGRALQDCNEEQADRELALSNRIQGQIGVMCEDYEWAVKAVKYAMIGYGLAIASGLGLSPSELERVRYAGIQGIDLAPMEYVITNLSGYGSLKEAKLKQLENLGENEPDDKSQPPADTGKGKKKPRMAVLQKDAAKAMGISREQLRKIEKGEADVPQRYPGRSDAMHFYAWAESYRNERETALKNSGGESYDENKWAHNRRE